jgi:hypothetical protein
MSLPWLRQDPPKDSLWRRLLRRCSPRFAKYRPAPRLGTRRVEQRLLRRLGNTALETAI